MRSIRLTSAVVKRKPICQKLLLYGTAITLPLKGLNKGCQWSRTCHKIMDSCCYTNAEALNVRHFLKIDVGTKPRGFFLNCEAFVM